MNKKLPNIKINWPATITVVALLTVWQLATTLGLVPAFMLPSPVAVVMAFVTDFENLMSHAQYTLQEAAMGLAIAIATGFFTAMVMARYASVKKALYPLLVVTQTVPPIAIAPLLVLWFGFGMAPKVLLIVVVCFFPMAVGFLDGFTGADPDQIRLLRTMGATRGHIFRHVQLPNSLPHFFSGLKVSASYCIVSAVIAEWLGGTEGLGVYMTRVRKSYAFDQMFAVIILISALSVILMVLVGILEKKSMPYKHLHNERNE